MVVHLSRTPEHPGIIQPDQVTNIYCSVHTRVKPGQPWCWQRDATHAHTHARTHTVRRWRYQGVLVRLISRAKVGIRRSAAFEEGLLSQGGKFTYVAALYSLPAYTLVLSPRTSSHPTSYTYFLSHVFLVCDMLQCLLVLYQRKLICPRVGRQGSSQLQ